MAKTKSSLLVIFILIAGDVLAINCAFIFVYWLRFYSGLLRVTWAPPDIKAYINVFIFVSLFLLFVLRSYGLYATRKRLSRLDEYFYTTKAVTLTMIFLMAMTFLYREFSYSRSLIVLTWAASVLFLWIVRFLVDKFELWRLTAKGEYKRALIIGTQAMGIRMAKLIRNNSRLGYKVEGFLSFENSAEALKEEAAPVLGSIDNLAEIIKKNKIDEVILTETGLPHAQMIDIMLKCEKYMVEFRMVPDLLEMMASQLTTHTFGGITLLGLRESALNETYNRMLKRAVDIAGSAFGLIITSWAFLILTILIKRDSPGPVFYKQKRVGEDGRNFSIYKFRTMRVGSEKDTGPVWAKEDDPRRTGIGIFLRRYNIDELPQLFNVLRGDMSLVGPRPERPEFVGRFKEDIPRYMARHKIRSGMTGWAQVNGLRGDTSIEERTKYDLYYIENWSIWLDLKILVMSFSATKNAY